MPARAAGSLADLVPVDVAGRLADGGIDINKIAADAVASDFSAASLIDLTVGNKQVSVWLE